MKAIAFLFLSLILSTLPLAAAASISQSIDPTEVGVGDQVSISITVQNGNVRVGDVHLPAVDGLQVLGTSIQIRNVVENGVASSAVSFNYMVTPTRLGDITIPAFNVNLQDGGVLRTQQMKLHVTGNNAASPGPSSPFNASPQAAPPASLPATPNFNPHGPVVMPPNQPPAPDDATDNSISQNVPKDSDGRPAKVFIIITPQTTDAYVGQTIPMRIDFYLRLDVAYRQNSLPTIKGSDFLMTDLPTRFNQDFLIAGGEQYLRQTWNTAISAPKSGDFPLQMKRDTYWVKGNNSPFANSFFSTPSLAHEAIDSNQFTFHVRPLPQEGRPANFTGAIGDLKVAGTAQPDSVAVGEPITLHFTVTGQGNFDYVHSPTLAESSDWKAYTPTSKMDYLDEAHTQGTKTFEEAVIPQKNGTLPLPKASFSYFNPTSKQYVTVPVELPSVTVTGTAVAATAAPVPTEGAASTAPTPPPKSTEMAANRPFLGTLQTSLSPVYREPWYWAVQGGLLSAVVLSAFVFVTRSRRSPEDLRAERLRRRQSVHEEESAMGAAVREGNALAFFTSARHAVQLELGARWRLQPEALTLGEIQQRDPDLAETLEPLFLQADEVIYSGHAAPNLDLPQWERNVREFLEQQPA